MKRLGLFFFGCAVILAACSNEDEIPGQVIIYKEYLIDAYIEPETLEMYESDGALWLKMKGSEYATWSTGAAYQEFLRQAALHGGRLDREISIAPDIYYLGRAGYFCYAEDFESIDLTCDQPWDDTHPAGSSLNEFAYIAYCTFAPFVRSGNTGYGVVEEVKRLDQIGEKDLDMVTHGMLRVRINFKEPPQVRQVYTLTLTTESGRTMTADWVYEPSE